MKKFLILSFCAAGAAALASANTISVLCPTSGGSGFSGSSTSVCNTASISGSVASFDSIVLTYKLDADFGLGAGSIKENFDVSPDGPTDAFGGALDHAVDQLVSDTNRGIVGTFTILSPTLSEVDAALGGVVITGTWSSGTGSFNNAAFDYQVDVNYTPDPNGSPVPEPADLGVMTVALIGLGFVARRKRAEKLSS